MNAVACGSRDIRDIVSAYTVWFTFVFRTPTPRAVEDFIVKVLPDSRGSRHLAGFCLASLIYILIISQGWGFVKREIQISLNFFYFRALPKHP